MSELSRLDSDTMAAADLPLSPAWKLAGRTVQARGGERAVQRGLTFGFYCCIQLRTAATQGPAP